MAGLCPSGTTATSCTGTVTEACEGRRLRSISGRGYCTPDVNGNSHVGFRERTCHLASKLLFTVCLSLCGDLDTAQ